MMVLSIEDDPETARAIKLMIEMNGWVINQTDLGEEGADLARLYDHDIILLDLNLPDMSGYEVIKTLRTRKVKTPILVVSGLCDVQDRVRALEFGADDYLTKPFHPDELIAKINAITRRSVGITDSVGRFGDLGVNFTERMATMAGKRIPLTIKEFAMLEVLARKNGAVITKEMFLTNIYGGRDEPVMKTIDVFVCKLRAKLRAASGGREFIETIWGRGYALRAPEMVVKTSFMETRSAQKLEANAGVAP